MEVGGLLLMQEGPPVDRSGWHDGPWDDEPIDRADWREHGVVCSVARGRDGVWCGYVIVPPRHPWHGLHPYGVDGRERIDLPADVDPGLSVAWPWRADPEWWVLGWDHHHYGEEAPGGPDTGGYGRYATIRQVVREVRVLAAYAAEVAS